MPSLAVCYVIRGGAQRRDVGGGSGTLKGIHPPSNPHLVPGGDGGEDGLSFLDKKNRTGWKLLFLLNYWSLSVYRRQGYIDKCVYCWHNV